MPDKKQIIKSLKATARKLGHAPSRAEFVSRAGIPLRSVLQWFPSWNDAVRAAGFRPYALNARRDDRALLEDWGKVARKSRAAPSRRVYLLLGKYYPGTFAKRFGSWLSVPLAFRNFAEGQRKWADVLALLPAPVLSGRGPQAGSQRLNRDSASAAPPCKTWHAQRKDRPTYGNPTPFRWLRHEPVNEQGVVLLFGMLAKNLGYLIENVHKGFPDCEAKRQVGPDRWQRVHLEFEFESRNFREHGHPTNGCDVIVCWRHNWQGCPEHLEVLELASVVKSAASSEG